MKMKHSHAGVKSLRKNNFNPKSYLRTGHREERIYIKSYIFYSL